MYSRRNVFSRGLGLEPYSTDVPEPLSFCEMNPGAPECEWQGPIQPDDSGDDRPWYTLPVEVINTTTGIINTIPVSRPEPIPQEIPRTLPPDYGVFSEVSAPLGGAAILGIGLIAALALSRKRRKN